MDLTLFKDCEPFIGGSIQSVLALVDDQDVKDQLLWDGISEIYRATQLMALPYPIPFGQAHCLCCKWNCPFSSARAVLPSCRTTFTAYFTIGDRIVASDVRYIFFDDNLHPTRPVESPVFTIQPGRKSIWCGLRADYHSRLLQHMLFLRTLPSRHANYVQCKHALLIISACRS
jgi:hypothetical protein